MKQLNAIGVECPTLFTTLKMFINLLEMGERAHIVATANESLDRMTKLGEIFDIDIAHHPLKEQHHFMITKKDDVKV